MKTQKGPSVPAKIFSPPFPSTVLALQSRNLTTKSTVASPHNPVPTSATVSEKKKQYKVAVNQMDFSSNQPVTRIKVEVGHSTQGPSLALNGMATSQQNFSQGLTGGQRVHERAVYRQQSARNQKPSMFSVNRNIMKAMNSNQRPLKSRKSQANSQFFSRASKPDVLSSKDQMELLSTKQRNSDRESKIAIVSPSSFQHTLSQNQLQPAPAEEVQGAEQKLTTSCSATQLGANASSINNGGRSKNSPSQANLSKIQTFGVPMNQAFINQEGSAQQELPGTLQLSSQVLPSSTKAALHQHKSQKLFFQASKNSFKSRQLQPNFHDLFNEVKHTIQTEKVNIFDEKNKLLASRFTRSKKGKRLQMHKLKRKTSHLHQSTKLHDKSICDSNKSGVKPVSASSHIFQKKRQGGELLDFETREPSKENNLSKYENLRVETKQLSFNQTQQQPQQINSSDVIVLKSNQIEDSVEPQGDISNQMSHRHPQRYNLPIGNPELLKALSGQPRGELGATADMMSRVQNLKSALNETYNSNLSSHEKIISQHLGDGQAMCFGSNRVVTKSGVTHQSVERRTYQKVYQHAESKDTMGRNQVGSSMSSKHGGGTRQHGTNINLDLSQEPTAEDLHAQRPQPNYGNLLNKAKITNQMSPSSSMSAIKPRNFSISIQNLEFKAKECGTEDAASKESRSMSRAFPSSSQKNIGLHRNSSSLHNLHRLKNQVGCGSTKAMSNFPNQDISFKAIPNELYNSGEIRLSASGAKVFKPTSHHGTYFSVPESDEKQAPIQSAINDLIIESSGHFSTKEVIQKRLKTANQQTRFKKQFEKEFFKLSKQISLQSSSFYLRNIEKQSKVSTLSNSQKYDGHVVVGASSQVNMDMEGTKIAEEKTSIPEVVFEDILKQEKNILIEMDNLTQSQKGMSQNNDAFFLQTSEPDTLSKGVSLKRPSGGTYLRGNELKTNSFSSETNSNIASARMKDEPLEEPNSGTKPTNLEDTQNNINPGDFQNTNLTPKLHIVQFSKAQAPSSEQPPDEKKKSRRASAQHDGYNRGSRKTLADSSHRMSYRQRKSSQGVDQARFTARNLSELEEFSNGQNWNMKEVLKSQLIEAPKDMGLLVKEQKKNVEKRVLLTHRELIDGIKKNPSRFFQTQRSSEFLTNAAISAPQNGQRIVFDSTTSSQFDIGKQGAFRVSMTKRSAASRPVTSRPFKRMDFKSRQQMTAHQKTVENRYKQREALFLNKHNQQAYIKQLVDSSEGLIAQNFGPRIQSTVKKQDRKQERILKNSLSQTVNQFMPQAPLKFFKQEINSDNLSIAQTNANMNHCCSLRGLGRKTKHLFKQVAQSEIDNKTLVAHTPQQRSNYRPLSNMNHHEGSELTTHGQATKMHNKDSTMANQQSAMDSIKESDSRQTKPILRSSKNLMISDFNTSHMKPVAQSAEPAHSVNRGSKTQKYVSDFQHREGMPENNIYQVTGNKQYEDDFIEMKNNILFGLSFEPVGKRRGMHVADLTPQNTYVIQPILDYNKNLCNNISAVNLDFVNSREIHRNDYKLGLSPKMGSSHENGTQELKQLDSDNNSRSGSPSLQHANVPKSIMVNNPHIKKVRLNSRNPNRTTTLVKFKPHHQPKKQQSYRKFELVNKQWLHKKRMNNPNFSFQNQSEEKERTSPSKNSASPTPHHQAHFIQRYVQKAGEASEQTTAMIHYEGERSGQSKDLPSGHAIGRVHTTFGSTAYMQGQQSHLLQSQPLAQSPSHQQNEMPLFHIPGEIVQHASPPKGLPKQKHILIESILPQPHNQPLSPKPQKSMMDLGGNRSGGKGSHTLREAKHLTKGHKKQEPSGGVIGFTLKNSKKSSDAGHVTQKEALLIASSSQRNQLLRQQNSDQAYDLLNSSQKKSSIMMAGDPGSAVLIQSSVSNSKNKKYISEESQGAQMLHSVGDEGGIILGPLTNNMANTVEHDD